MISAMAPSPVTLQAGIAAALAARKGCTPRALDVKELQDVMTNQGIDLFDE